MSSFAWLVFYSGQDTDITHLAKSRGMKRNKEVFDFEIKALII